MYPSTNNTFESLGRQLRSLVLHQMQNPAVAASMATELGVSLDSINEMASKPRWDAALSFRCAEALGLEVTALSPGLSPWDNSRFLAFEGGEGMGKTTQIARLAEHLRAAGHEVVVTREPGGTDLGRVLREAIQQENADEHSHVAVRAEAMMYFADRAQHIETVILPALLRSAYVLCDRFEDSSGAYQSNGRGLLSHEVLALSRWASMGLYPGHVFVFDGSLELAASRREDKKLDRMEAAGADFHNKVREFFLARASQEPDRYTVIDAAGDRDEIAATLSGLVDLMPGARS